MQLIERVFLLQRIDVFSTTPSHHLARIALLASEVEAGAGAVLLSGSEVADAMYVVIEGELRADYPDGSSRPVKPGEAVGALAVLDDAPLGLEVRVIRASRLLRLTRRELRDLLQDHPDLGVSLLQGMAKRLRLFVEARPALVPPTSRPTLVRPGDRGLEQRGQ
jgi:CRP-like cAMP-binding protein